MAYIITGATGHIGNNLARALIKDEKEVVILTRRVDESIEKLNARILVGNLFDEAFLESSINEGDTVIHLIGLIDIKNKQKYDTLKVNYDLTKLIMDISVKKKVDRFIYFSTVDCIYKENDEIITEPLAIYPDKFTDNYSHTKALATKYVMEQREKNQDIKINILYPSAVIGTNDYKPSQIGTVVKDIIKGKIQFGISGGYNFVDVDDICKGTINLINRSLDGDFLLTGIPVTIYEFYDIVNRHLNRKKRTWKIPMLIVYLFIPFVPYLSKFVLKTINENYNYDNTKMKEILGVNQTSFDETIEKTIKFFKNQNK